MSLLEIIFWLSAGCVGYTYVGYPLLLALLARVRGADVIRGPFRGSVSFVLAVHNEEAHLDRRLRELLDMLCHEDLEGEIIVVSDGSTDRTVAIAQAYAAEGVRVIELPRRSGKAAALSNGCAAARGEILLFADARQRWDPEALGYLLENFADPRVGAVSGDLLLETSPGVMAGVGLYWRYEKWLRRRESRLESTVGVTGAISAVRRKLFGAVPVGTLLDDVYWPLRVALQGARVIHDDRAHAYDRLPDNPRDEFRRKVRTLTGNFQLVTRLPAALIPGRNPLWWQFVSHKLLRLAVPWALIAMLLTSALLPGRGFGLVLLAQVMGYSLGITGTLPSMWRCSRVLGAAGSFVVLNAAAWLAFWVWLSGRAERSWQKITYADLLPAPSASANAIPVPSPEVVVPAGPQGV